MLGLVPCWQIVFDNLPDALQQVRGSAVRARRHLAPALAGRE
jgi:hypothetical protein